MQQPVGEDMPALGVGAKLDLVDGQEIRAIASGIASTVQTQYCVRSGTIRSSPVTSATTDGPRRATILS
jgi:hypothetical protein